MSSVFSFLLMLAAIAAGLWGGTMLTQATLGVGVICGGCLLGILARLLQSEAQHQKLQKMLKSSLPTH